VAYGRFGANDPPTPCVDPLLCQGHTLVPQTGAAMRSDIFKADNMAQPATQVGMSLQHSKCVKYAVNGEGLALMAVRGQGEVWFASSAQDCFILDLEQGDALSINGRNVVCFDPSLSYDIQMVRGAGMFGGGLFNSVFSGTGRLSITSDGQPIVIPVSQQAPVFVDTDAIVGWSSGLQTSIQKSQSLKSLLRGGSGELFQLGLYGQGFAIVQPSEGRVVAGQQQSSGGGLLSNVLGG